MIAGFEVTDKTCDFGLITDLANSVKDDFKDFGETNSIVTTIADKGYQDPDDMMNALENGIIPNVILNHRKEEIILETDYEESEITEELVNSTDTKDIQKCLKAGIIPAIYKPNINEIKVLKRKTYKKKENGVEYREWWEITIKDGVMNWTALRFWRGRKNIHRNL